MINDCINKIVITVELQQLSRNTSHKYVVHLLWPFRYVEKRKVLLATYVKGNRTEEREKKIQQKQKQQPTPPKMSATIDARFEKLLSLLGTSFRNALVHKASESNSFSAFFFYLNDKNVAASKSLDADTYIFRAQRINRKSVIGKLKFVHFKLGHRASSLIG